MSHRDSESQQLDRFLGLLGIGRSEPSLNNLKELIRAYLTRVPFENVSKLYYQNNPDLRGLPDLATFLKGIQKSNFGGTCYANNYYLNLLLETLGYDPILCGADMDSPDVHLVNIVSIENHEYLIDAGYGAPFLDPLPRDLSIDHIINHGRQQYILKPQDAENNSRLNHYRDGELIHGYTAKPIPRPIEFFEEVIADSFDEQAMFMNNVRLNRFINGLSVSIQNLNLVETDRSATRITKLANRQELIEAIVDKFKIPGEIATKAVSRVILV